jgi:hypothetical protein
VAVTKTKLDDVCQHVTAEEAAKILGWTEGTLLKFVNVNQHKLPEEWRWFRGVCYFQASERGNIVYNAHVLRLWHIARSQNDPMIYQNAVAEFQRVVRGGK